MQVNMRRLLGPALALSALSLSAWSILALSVSPTAASAFTGQPKPQLAVEAERSPQGVRITLKGKNWAAGARVKLTATRAQASSKAQDFGMADADSTGVFSVRKVVICTTNSQEDGALETVTFTAADSATGIKYTASVRGGAWVCQ